MSQTFEIEAIPPSSPFDLTLAAPVRNHVNAYWLGRADHEYQDTPLQQSLQETLSNATRDAGTYEDYGDIAAALRSQSRHGSGLNKTVAKAAVHFFDGMQDTFQHLMGLGPSHGLVQHAAIMTWGEVMKPQGLTSIYHSPGNFDLLHMRMRGVLRDEQNWPDELQPVRNEANKRIENCRDFKDYQLVSANLDQQINCLSRQDGSTSELQQSKAVQNSVAYAFNLLRHVCGVPASRDLTAIKVAPLVWQAAHRQGRPFRPMLPAVLPRPK